MNTVGDTIEVILANTDSEVPDSYLSHLEKLSQSRGDGGMLHGGHIYFIQQKLSDEDGFFLKVAIQLILDDVPSVWPMDLPELVESGKVEKMNAKQLERFREYQKSLIIPIGGYDIIRVILAAREYEKLQ